MCVESKSNARGAINRRKAAAARAACAKKFSFCAHVLRERAREGGRARGREGGRDGGLGVVTGVERARRRVCVRVRACHTDALVTGGQKEKLADREGSSEVC